MISIAEPSISIDLTLPLKKSFHLLSFIAHLTLNNKLVTKILNLWTDALNACRQAWWIEILTAQPNCTYYFGPFAGAWEANIASKGFVEDLECEFAQCITIKIDRHSQPDLLTIEHDSIELLGAYSTFLVHEVQLTFAKSVFQQCLCTSYSWKVL